MFDHRLGCYHGHAAVNSISHTARVKPDYGLDAPGVVRNLALGGFAAAIAAIAVQFLPFQAADRNIASAWFSVTSAVFFVEVAWMVYSSRVGKLRKRQILFDSLSLTGDERVLDVGCGRGLLMVEAAKRLPRGMAVGIDLWSARDLSGNRPEVTLENARKEGVAERVQVVTGDMRRLPFSDASFNAVVASFAIHNIGAASGREAAVREIDRVLKRGGRVALVDFARTAEYVRTLRKAAWTDVGRSRYGFQMFPPVRTVRGSKP